MGKHYVPQEHLRRFQIPERPEFVWMYDKKARDWREAKIAKVAQEADFYDPEVEIALAKVVELPGNIAIDKLLAREKLNNRQRSELALYLMTMATRGPKRRNEALKLVPGVLREVADEVKAAIEESVEDEQSAELAAARLIELQEVEAKFAAEVPQNVMDQIRTPFWSQRTVECILNMAWHILPAPSDMHFITCDTPAHFFDGLGVGNLDSEFTFTISKDFALIGEHQQSWGTVYEKPQAQLAKEVNRRILSHAERFVFSPRKSEWIETVANKGDPYLSKILWQQ